MKRVRAVAVGLFLCLTIGIGVGEGEDFLQFDHKAGGKTIRHKYVFGTKLYQQPDIPKPDKGVPYFDPIFGTKVTRVSDCKTDKLRAFAKKNCGSLMHPAYPKHNYDNADGSYLLFYGSYGSGKVLYDAKDLRLIKSLSTKAVNWGQPVEPRWDAHNPDVLYYQFSPATALSMYNVRTDKFEVIHDFRKDFPGATCITMVEEGDCSYDSRYFAFLLRAPRRGDRWAHVAVFCYDRVEDRIVGKIELPIPGFERQGGGNWVGMSPSGKYVLLGTSPMLVYDREFKKPPVKLTHGGGCHCDVGLDDEGREVIFYIGGRTFSPGGQSDGCYAMCDLETGTEIVLSGKIKGIPPSVGGTLIAVVFLPRDGVWFPRITPPPPNRPIGRSTRYTSWNSQGGRIRHHAYGGSATHM
jgi:hypothetical protein